MSELIAFDMSAVYWTPHDHEDSEIPLTFTHVYEYRESMRIGFTCSGHTADRLCVEGECWSCGERDCPDGRGEHYWADGCPSCSVLTAADPMEV
jgi:hypothetical protein